VQRAGSFAIEVALGDDGTTLADHDSPQIAMRVAFPQRQRALERSVAGGGRWRRRGRVMACSQ
jgi:hypothetical protein